MTPYQIGNTAVLISINNAFTNFSATFEIFCKDNFYISIMSQTDLDNGKEIEYKHITNNKISGKIENNDNIYQQYQILLKADTETVVDVNIDCNENKINKVEKIIQNNEIIEKEDTSIVTGIVIVIVCLVLFFYFKEETTKLVTKSTDHISDVISKLNNMNL